MHPRSENTQRCFTFQLSVSPRARIFSYTDHMANQVHHFDIPGQHNHLTMIADALGDIDPPMPIPASLGSNAWRELDEMVQRDDYWDMMMPSYFARPSPELEELAKEFGADRRDGRDPLEVVIALNSQLYQHFTYVKQSTSVDSPIEDALRSRAGVCQDFAHVMISLVRQLGIPCRYISGYLYHDSYHSDRSSDGATDAWVEALLPGLGWIGLDPTNNLIVGQRHIRTAVGRDYADVAPTVGTMKGRTKTELQVRVRVTPSDAVLPPDQEFAADEEWSRFLEKDQETELILAQQQQQQQ